MNQKPDYNPWLFHLGLLQIGFTIFVLIVMHLVQWDDDARMIIDHFIPSLRLIGDLVVSYICTGVPLGLIAIFGILVE